MLWVAWDYLIGFVRCILLFIVRFVSGSSLLLGLGEPWCRDGGIPQGCLLSMIFIVALCVPWCRHLDALPDVKPQLYADILKCSAERPCALFEAARFTAQYVRSVGQDVSSGKCVLLSTSKSVRKARSKRVREATFGVASVGASLLCFQVKLGLVRGKSLPAGLHAAEASYVSSSSVSAFRAAIVRAVWSTKMPLANASAILNLLDGPVGVDPAFHIVWARFRMMRRYLAHCLEEEPRIFRMLDLTSLGAQGHGPVHLLLLSWVLLGMGRRRVGLESPSLTFV